MDSDSSDSEVVGPHLPPGYEVPLLIDVFGTDALSVAASVITKRSFSGPFTFGAWLVQCMIVASLSNCSHSYIPDLSANSLGTELHYIFGLASYTLYRKQKGLPHCS